MIFAHGARAVYRYTSIGLLMHRGEYTDGARTVTRRACAAHRLVGVGASLVPAQDVGALRYSVTVFCAVIFDCVCAQETTTSGMEGPCLGALRYSYYALCLLTKTATRYDSVG